LLVADIRVKPTDVQQFMLETIWNGFKRRRAWPTLDFVDREIDEKFHVTFLEVARGCPRVQIDFNPIGYGWVFAEAQTLESAQRDTAVGLTLAGMAHVGGASAYEDLILQILKYFVLSESNVEPDPASVVSATVNQLELQELTGDITKGTNTDVASFSGVLQSLMYREPAFWHSNPWAYSDGKSVELSPVLRLYRGTETVGDYVDRVMAQAPQMAVGEPLHESSLSLPDAIDFLNIKWRLKHGFLLFADGDNTTSSQLALQCGSREEFMSRCSALWSLLDKAHLPDNKKAMLHDLKVFLIGDGGEEARNSQIAEACDVLRSVGKLRAAQQHPGTDAWKDQELAARVMGFSWPPSDWGVAWSTIQRRCVWALSLLRDEVGEPE
jgi:hypothetical protein